MVQLFGLPFTAPFDTPLVGFVGPLHRMDPQWEQRLQPNSSRRETCPGDPGETLGRPGKGWNSEQVRY